MKTDGFAFDVELIPPAYHMGIHIDEVMIHWKEMGKSSIRLRHVFQMARGILAIRRNIREFKKSL